MLQVNNIDVFFVNVIHVLKGVSLELHDGKIAALLGGNGAGKSTMAKSITGMIRTEEGEIRSGIILFDGERIDTLSQEKIVKKGIAMVWEGRRIFEQLTVENNLVLGGYAAPYTNWNKWTKKELEVVYYYAGKKFSVLIPEGEKLMLP